MIRIFNHKSFHFTLFWKFFTSYFMLILVPVIVASFFTYFFMVRLIENDAEKLNTTIMRNFSNQTDATFTSLQTEMINLLGVSNLKSFLLINSGTPYNQDRNEMLQSLMKQLNTIETGDLKYKAYLYFVNYDLVVDADSFTSKELYFKYHYPIEDPEKSAFFSNFSGKKMMHFTEPYAIHQKPLFSEETLSSSSNVSALMSYPFNSDTPDVYLVVSITQEKLNERIRIQQNWFAGTAIVDNIGNVVSQTGSAKIEAKSLLNAIQTNSEGALFFNSDDKLNAISYYKSRFSNSWYYVSFIDLQTLLKPAQMIRMISIVFLVFFLVVGSIVSYYLSRKLYNPILEIKTGLETHRKSGGPIQQDGNDFDVIKRFSNILISENQQLSHMVGGMFSIVQEHFITKILLGEYRDSLSIEYYSKEIQFKYNTKEIRTVLCIEIQYYSQAMERLSETSKSFLLVELKNEIQKSMPSTVWLCQIKSDLLGCVVQHDAGSNFGPKEAAETIKLILLKFKTYYKASIGVGRTVHDIEELHNSYDYAIAMLQHKGLHAEVEICSEANAADDRTPLDSFLPASEVNRIFNMFKTRDYARMLQSVFDLLDAGTVRNANAYQVKHLCYDVLNTWIRAVETERNDFSIPFYSNLYDTLHSCVTWDEIKQCFVSIHLLLFQPGEPRNRKEQLTEILEHIHGHFGEELSIERFAGQMNMSPGHFSRTFKDEVGEKYVEYIAKYRLTKAKQFLLETNMKIDEIAEKVGYMGRNSFIRIFRKYEAITPAKYRTIHQNHRRQKDKLSPRS